MRDRGFVHRQQAGADKLAAVVPGIGRPHHPAVQHVRQAHIVYVGGFTGRLGRNIDARGAGAHQAILRLRFQRRVAGNRQFDMTAGHQLGVAERLPLRAADHALLQRQLFHRRIEALRRLAQQPTARFGGGVAQRHGGDLQRGAGDGGALIRRAFGVAQHHSHLIHAQVQLFGDDLPERGAHAGAEIDMAVKGIDFAAAARGDKQPLLLGLQHRRLPFGHRPRRRLHAVDDQQHAVALQQFGLARR